MSLSTISLFLKKDDIMKHSEEIRNNDRNGPEKSDADYRFREERINQICSEVYMKNYLQCCMNLPQ